MDGWIEYKERRTESGTYEWVWGVLEWIGYSLDRYLITSSPIYRFPFPPQSPYLTNLKSPRQRRRFIPQNLVNLFHNLIRQLGNDLEGPDALSHLLDFRRAGDGAGDVGVFEDPRQC